MESTLRLLTNIEFFSLLDIGRHNLNYQGKQRFKGQLHYAIFILDKKTEDDKKNIQQHLWDNARELLDS